ARRQADGRSRREKPPLPPHPADRRYPPRDRQARRQRPPRRGPTTAARRGTSRSRTLPRSRSPAPRDSAGPECPPRHNRFPRGTPSPHIESPARSCRSSISQRASKAASTLRLSGQKALHRRRGTDASPAPPTPPPATPYRQEPPASTAD